MDKFHLADLNEEEYARLKALENELGIVLIAWEDGEVKQHTYENYYDLVEDDRL